MRHRRLLTKPLIALILAAFASAGIAGTVALSAEPSEGTITIEKPTTWSGKVTGYSQGNICARPGSGGLPQCDEFLLTVDVDEKYWESFDGGAELEFVPRGTDLTANLNVVVIDDDGRRVDDGGAEPSGTEQVMIPEASRGGSPYRVVVYNNTINATGDVQYDASARVESQAKTPTSGGTSDKPIPTETVRDAPCEDGFSAGVFPCENVDLKSFVPISELGGLTPGETGDETVDDAINDRLNDIWGWTDPKDGREYAIVGKRDGTAFVDVTDASNPRYLGELPTTAGAESPVFNVWRDAKVYKDHAFIVSEEPVHGMQIFDLTRLRGLEPSQARTFSEDAHYQGDGLANLLGNSHNISINEETGFAYLIGTNTCAGGSHIVNIQEPQNPQFAGCVAEDEYTHDNQCVVYRGPDSDFAGREICFDFNEDTLTIVDVTNKGEDAERPILARLPYDGSAYTHQGWLTPDQRYVLMNDELDERGTGVNTSTRIVDVRELRAPKLIGTYKHPSKAIDHNNYTKGSSVFQSNYRSGLRILDTRKVADGELSTSGFFDVFPLDDEPQFNGTWSNYPYFKSGNVVVSGVEQGLFVVRPKAEAGGVDGLYAGEPGDAESAGGETTAATPRAETPAPAPPPPASAPVRCEASDGFESVGVKRRGKRGLMLAFERRRDEPVTVDVFQQSVGRRVLGERLVARFRGRESDVRWNGRANRSGRKVRDGFYFARFRMGRGDDADVRRVALRRRDGRFSKRPGFHRRTACSLLRRFKLERPIFGGRTNRALGISFALQRDARVQVDVLRGSRVVRRYRARDREALRTARLRFDAEGRKRGDYRVRITVTRPGERTLTSTLTARRL